MCNQQCFGQTVNTFFKRWSAHRGTWNKPDNKDGNQWRSQPKMFDFRRITLFCLGYRLSKCKMTIYAKIWGRPGLPGYVDDRNDQIVLSRHHTVFHAIPNETSIYDSCTVTLVEQPSFDTL